MTVTPTSKAAVVASSVENEAFAVTARVVPRKIVIVGTFDPAKTDIVSDELMRVFSPQEVGALTGYGFMLHRLAEQAYKGSQNIETWLVPQDEPTGVQATGDIDFTGSTGTPGTIALYIAGILDRPVLVPLQSTLTAAQICALVVAAINAIKELPVTAAVNATPEICDITAKSFGQWGNDISIEFNLKAGDELPPNVVAAVTPMSGGTGTYDISTALNALGTYDNANEKFFTELIHGYGTSALDSISNYVGLGDTKEGLYSELVHKPFQSIIGNVVAGSSGLSTLIALGDARKETDRASGVIAVPGSRSHPQEIAAQVLGHRARINNIRAEENYVDIILRDIDPGLESDRWTVLYTNRDTAVKSGVSPTFVKNGIVYIQNLVTFYHPDSVPPDSNGYASFRNLSIIQNLLNSQYRTFNTEKWKNFTIVEDVTKVSNTTDREKVRDIDSVIDECIALLEAWYSNAWIYETTFAIDQLKESGAVVIRSGTDGFDINLKVILSVEGLILNIVTKFDTSIAVLAQ